MNIEIKLKNVKFCNLCPCSQEDNEGDFCYCGMGIQDSFDYNKSVIIDREWGTIRPQECIDKHGE